MENYNQKEETPLVSIIVTCYNHEKYIGECISSILAQTYKNIEFFITDDCSPDHSVDVIEHYMEQIYDRFVRAEFIRNKTNRGAVPSLNNMICMSKGKYIKLVDGDDMLFPDAISHLVSFMEKHQEYGLTYSNYVFCNVQDQFDMEVLAAKEIQKTQAVPENISQALYENDFIIAPTVLIRKCVYENVGLHDENLGIADWEFWLRASFEYSIGYLDAVTAAYRIVPDSMSRFTKDVQGRKRLQRMIHNELMILDKFKNHPSIKSRIGIRNCCDQGISLAIDLEADEVIDDIRKYLIENKSFLSYKILTKYMLYRLGIWKKMIKIVVIKKN